jgi:hypothetical protein
MLVYLLREKIAALNLRPDPSLEPDAPVFTVVVSAYCADRNGDNAYGPVVTPLAANPKPA